MNTLSIEKLKKMRAHAASLCHDSTVSALDELISLRELKGDQVPVAWRMWPEGNYEEGFIVSHEEDPAHKPGETDADGRHWVSSPLYDRPQKPVEVADSIAMQNVKDIAHCLSDIRRFVEAKFMTVGDLPSPEGLLLSGPEWKHESDAIIAALNRVADFYESQQVAEGGLLELGEEKLYRMVCDLRAVNQTSMKAIEEMFSVLREYGIIGSY